MQTITRKLTALILASMLMLTMALPAFAELNTPTGYDPAEYTEMVNFLSTEDANGVSNGTKLNANYNIWLFWHSRGAEMAWAPVIMRQ